MKFSKFAKNAAFVMGTVLTAGIGTMTYMAVQAKQDMKQAMQKYDGQKINAFLANQKEDPKSVARFRNNLDVNTALLFYSGSNISQKVAGYKSVDGHELIQEKADQFIVWLADEQREKALEKILVGIDPETKMQVCATYDIENKDLVVSLGGTDFKNFKDLASATTSLTGALNPRAAVGAAYGETIVNVLQERHPELKTEEINAFIVSHSSGTPASMMVAFADKGIHVKDAVLLDPCGVRASFDAAEKFGGIKQDLLEKNVTTIKGVDGPLALFKAATAVVGKFEACDAKGHLGKHYIDAFNIKRSNQNNAGM